MKSASYIDIDTKVLYRKGSNGMARVFSGWKKKWFECSHLTNWELHTLPFFKNI